MTNAPRKPRLIFINGPTASGKTDFALRAAAMIGARNSARVEILNSDSVQVYKEIEIGTAKPSPEQRAQIRHHLIDHVGVGDIYTAGRYRDDARKIIEDGGVRGVDAFLIVGGSGFYIQALEKGMFDVGDVDPHLRAEIDHELKTHGLEPLYLELQKRDLAYADKVKPQDTYRIVRALELMRASRKTMTMIQNDFHESSPEANWIRGYDVKKIGLKPDRDVLRMRIARRARAMLDAGLVDEVRNFRARGLGEWAPLLSVGYLEVQDHLDGRLSANELPELITTRTMQLAKRQMTWFKRDQDIVWAASEPEFIEATHALKSMLT